MSEDRPKKSWREIDRKKDRSAHRQEEKAPGGGPRRQRSQKSYRAALDRLFESGRIGELIEKEPQDDDQPPEETRLKLLRAIKTAEGRVAITKAVDAYIAHHELPLDADVLGKVLEHRNPSRQLEAMEKLVELTGQETPRRSRAIIGQLKLIRDTGDDRELIELATKLLDRLD
jgi:hypothetical protein